MTELVCKKHSPSGLSIPGDTCESGTKESGGGGDGVNKETTGRLAVTTCLRFLCFSIAAAVPAINICLHNLRRAKSALSYMSPTG